MTQPDDTLLSRILALSALEFEHLVYDLLILKGLRNVSWRTPGADGGRDLQGEYLQSDLSGDVQLERWYVECKRYSSSIDWPTLYAKLAYAENAQADFLLLCTTSTLSSPCKDEVERWRQRCASPSIRAWEGPRLERLVQREPLILAKYGLVEKEHHGLAVLPLLHLAAKSSHAAHGAAVLDGTCHPALELSTALLELATSLLQADFGRGGARRFIRSRDLYPWAECSGEPSGEFNPYGLRVLLAASRFLAKGEATTTIIVSGEDPRTLRITPFPESTVSAQIAKKVSLFADFEASPSTSGSLLVRIR